MISTKAISKSFGKLQVLKNINLEFSQGSVVALIGPNGSGKTTLIKCLLGLVIPDQGEIYFKGMNILGTWEYRKYIGYMPQINRFPEQMEVGRVFKMMRDLRMDGAGTDEELIHLFGLHTSMNKRMNALSGGTRQKVSAALAYLFQPEMLFLDEPTSGLDPVAAEHFKNKIIQGKQQGKITLITSHNMSEVEELADRVIFISDGSIGFDKNVSAILSETGVPRLNKALAKLMEGVGHA